MFKNKVFLFGLTFFILISVFALLWLNQRTISQFLTSVNIPFIANNKQARTISFIEGSSLVDVTVDLAVLEEIYATEVVAKSTSETLSLFEPITLELTDEKQGTSYAWEAGKHYESITIKKIGPTGKHILINIVPEVMRENGWDDRDIEQELELLLVQGVITTPSLTLTGAQIEQANKEAFQILEKRNFERFVKLQ